MNQPNTNIERPNIERPKIESNITDITIVARAEREAIPTRPPASESTAPRRDKNSHLFQTKTPPLNAMWTEEIVAAIGITGPLGKELARQLSLAIETDLKARWHRSRISKLVRRSFVKTIK